MLASSLFAMGLIGGALTALVVGPYFTPLQTIAASIIVAGVGCFLVMINHELRGINKRMDADGLE